MVPFHFTVPEYGALTHASAKSPIAVISHAIYRSVENVWFPKRTLENIEKEVDKVGAPSRATWVLARIVNSCLCAATG